jgi:hypothetical protein
MTKRNPFHKTYSLFVRKSGTIRWERISVTALTLNKARHHYQSLLINLSMTPGIECRLMPAGEITDPESIELVKAVRDRVLG